jgi:hypothetical protein
MSDGYTVDPAKLQEAAKGINDTIGALKGLGIDEEAEAGRGFGSLSLRGMQVGHQGLQQAFDGFCDRWSWGVRTLVQDGNQFAQRLGLSAGTYNDMEQYGVGVLKDAVNTVAGDPHATSQQVENESLSQIVAAAKPDYSAKSWEKTGQDAAATWKAEGRDVMAGPDGLIGTAFDAAGQGQQFDQLQNNTFGPPPGATEK